MKRILVLEDEELFGMLLRDVFAEEGYSVEGASDGQEAIRVGTEFQPDILFTDWRFTGTTGSEQVVEALRALKPDLKVVLLTGVMGREAEAAARTIKAYRLLVKPSSIDEILAAARAAAQELDGTPQG